MMYLWYAALFAPIIALIGLFLLRNIMPLMNAEFRKGMIHLLISASIAVASGIIAIILFIINIPLNNYLWDFVPVLYFISNMFYLFNIRSIEKIFKVMVFDEKETKMYE